ncbi:hypothetical protein EDD15DRAFT_2520061 [Pisolithus albus]|nr:hypothetical protein EDD15DRAFT_2520061 [Pisolithus albus]
MQSTTLLTCTSPRSWLPSCISAGSARPPASDSPPLTELQSIERNPESSLREITPSPMNILTISREIPLSNSLGACRTLVDVQDVLNHVSGSLPPEDHSAGREGTSEETTEGDGEGAGDTNEEIYECIGLYSRWARLPVTRMKSQSIPYFKVSISLESDPQGNAKGSIKDTLITTRECGHCGYRDEA